MLNIYDSIPDGLLQAEATELYALLGKPTLIHLSGENPQPLFICTLLHGNETTSFYAIRQLLNQYKEKNLPRSLSIFIGNVEAAASNVRRLDHQIDFNRTWPGTQHSSCAETDLMNTVTDIMRKRKPFASIDVHNNTGKNPYYGCVNLLNPHCLQLASNFSDITVYFTNPKGTQSSCFSDFCPAVVLECGQSGEPATIDFVARYLDTILNMTSLQATGSDSRLYHTIAIVKVPDIIDFGTDDSTELTLDSDLESQNFTRLKTDSLFARTRLDTLPFVINNESNENVTDEFFYLDGGDIRLRRDVILSMYTTRAEAIRQDCLCYFMEQINIA